MHHAFVPRRYLTRVIVGTIALAVLFRTLVMTVLPIPMEAGGVFTFATLDSLGGGALLALFHYEEKLRPHLPRVMKLCLVAGVALLALTTFFYVYRIGFRLMYTLLCLGVSLVLMVLIEKTSRGFSRQSEGFDGTPRRFVHSDRLVLPHEDYGRA
jgi:peptidoglycan/LPS O-acetylase OafA/YrhL